MFLVATGHCFLWKTHLSSFWVVFCHQPSHTLSEAIGYEYGFCFLWCKTLVYATAWMKCWLYCDGKKNQWQYSRFSHALHLCYQYTGNPIKCYCLSIAMPILTNEMLVWPSIPAITDSTTGWLIFMSESPFYYKIGTRTFFNFLLSKGRNEIIHLILRIGSNKGLYFFEISLLSYVFFLKCHVLSYKN